MTDGVSAELLPLLQQTIRAELTALELRIVDRLNESLNNKADHSDVEEVKKRLDNDMEPRLTALERFRYAIPSAAGISVVLGAAATVIALLH